MLSADPTADWTPERKPRKARPSAKRAALLAKVECAIFGLESDAAAVDAFLNPDPGPFVDPRQGTLPGVA